VHDARYVPLRGNGMNVRVWCYVYKNGEVVDLVLRKRAVGAIFNLSAAYEIPNRLLTEKILGLLGADESMISYVEDRLGHDRRYSIATEKVESLGWRPQRDLDEALAATVEWYRENRAWWEPLKAG